jgi:hypothetical protein
MVRASRSPLYRRPASAISPLYYTLLPTYLPTYFYLLPLYPSNLFALYLLILHCIPINLSSRLYNATLDSTPSFRNDTIPAQCRLHEGSSPSSGNP